MIQIPADSLKEAAKLLNRVRSARASLPVLCDTLAALRARARKWSVRKVNPTRNM